MEGMGSTYRPDHSHLPERLFAFPVSEEDSKDPGEEDCKVEKVRVPEGHRTVSPLTHVLV